MISSLDFALLGSVVAPLVLLAHRAHSDGESETRERLVSAIESQPGATPTQLADGLGLSLPTVIYHLRIILQSGRVTAVRSGRTSYCFPHLAGGPHSRRDAAVVAASEASRRVAALLAEDPFLTSSDIASRLGVSRQAVNKQILRIRKARLLVPVQDDECRLGWAPVECLRQLLSEGAQQPPGGGPS